MPNLEPLRLFNLSLRIRHSDSQGTVEVRVWGWENCGMNDLPGAFRLTLNSPTLMSCSSPPLSCYPDNNLFWNYYYSLQRTCWCSKQFQFRQKITVLKIETIKHRSPHLSFAGLITAETDGDLKTCSISHPGVVSKDITKEICLGDIFVSWPQLLASD